MQTSVPYSSRYFSPDPVKREATHALLGAFTRRILSALAFGGLGVGVRSMYKDNMSGSDVLGAFGTGALLGTGLSTAADIIGAGTGLAAGGRQSREEAIENIDNNAWKYYLMPGYGGYQIGSGLRGMMEKHASVQKRADGDLIIEKPGGKLTKDDVETALLVAQDYLNHRKKLAEAGAMTSLHSFGGSLTNMLLMGLLGAGAGAGAHAVGLGSSDLKGDVLTGASIGAGAGAVAQALGTLWGNAKRMAGAGNQRAWEKDVERYMAGQGDTAKKYLIPGYAGYKLGLF